MKRNRNLQPLSRQHHNALMAVLLLKKGVRKKASLSTMQMFVAKFWNDDLNNHFKQEENLFVSFNSRSTEASKLYEQMKSEHEQMRQMVHQISSEEVNYELLEHFYTALESHIRFEERIYFPLIESVATDEELLHIGNITEQLPDTTCIHFPVKFWE